MKRLLLSVSMLAIWAVSSVAIGCSATPIQVSEAPEELHQAVVLLEEPVVTGPLVDPEYEEDVDGVARRVKSELRRTLQDQGLRATTDPSVDYDGVLHTEIVLDMRGYDIVMSVETILADGGGDLVSGFSERQPLDPEMASDRFGYRTPEYIAKLAADDMLSSSPGRALESRSTAIADAHTEPEAEQPSSADVSDGEFISATPQRRSYALVIGVEDYRDLNSTEGARRDAEDFARLVTDGFGIPEDNVRVLLDSHATRGDIFSQLSWFQANITGGDRIYLYFAGHGSPETSDGTPFLMPYEAAPENLEHTGVQLSELIEGLEKTEAREVIAFIDTCFSGSGERSVIPEGTRPVVPESQLEPQEKSTSVAIFSASGPSEISGNRADEDRGLFTHYLLEGLGQARADMDGDGQISLSELHDYVSPRVAREARQIDREQNPSLFIADDMGAPDDVVVTWGVAAD